MKRFTGLCAGVLTVVLGGGAALAQPVIAPGGCATPPPPCQAGPGPCTAPNPSGAEGAGSESNPYPSMNPSQSAEAAPGAGNEAPPTPEGSGAAFANEGAPRAGATGNTMTAGGTGLASATATGGVTTNQTAFGNNGLILPGLLTAAQVDGAVPANRLFVDYGYFNEFRSVAATATLTPAARGTLQPTVQSRTIDGFNLNRYDFGVEKTFFNGCASVMVRAPILEAADNVAGQPIDGFGDVEAGIKCEILRDCETGDALTGGCDVAIPTGRAETFTVAAFNNGAGGAVFTPRTTTSLNPTFIQPYLCGITNRGCLWVQNFTGVLISTDSRISPFINEDLSAGYTIFHSSSAITSALMPTSLTPTIEAQLLLPTDHEGTGPVPGLAGPGAALTSVSAFRFPDQLFLTEGLQLGLGEHSVLSGGIVEPVVGPKAFSVGVTVGLNIFF